MYTRIWIEDEHVQRAIVALRELALFWENGFSPSESKPDRAKTLEGIAKELESSLRNSTKEPTKDEELAGIDEVLNEWAAHAGFQYAGETRKTKLLWYLKSITADKESHLSLFASFVDTHRVNLRALQLMIEAAAQGGTHKIKDSRLHMCLDILQGMVSEMTKTAEHEPHTYFQYHGRPLSWDVNKLQTRVYQQEAEIKRLEAALSGKEDEAAVPAVEPDQIPF